MHQLLVLRHAKADRPPGIADRDRPLTDTGRKHAAAMRDSMQRLGLAPDLILVSPSVRTMQTLGTLEPWDDTPLTETIEDLYLAGCAQMISVLRNVAETVRTVLLIGHNPGLHDLVNTIGTKKQDDFPTCTLAELTILGRWRDLPAGGRLARLISRRHTLP